MARKTGSRRPTGDAAGATGHFWSAASPAAFGDRAKMPGKGKSRILYEYGIFSAFWDLRLCQGEAAIYFAAYSRCRMSVAATRARGGRCSRPGMSAPPPVAKPFRQAEQVFPRFKKARKNFD